MKSKLFKVLYLAIILIAAILVINYNKGSLEGLSSFIYMNEKSKNIEMTGKNKDLESFDKIEINSDISNIEIIGADKFKIEVKYEIDREVNYEIIDKSLKVTQEKNENKMNRMKKEDRGSIKIYVPRSKLISSVNIDTYISDISLKNLKINEVELDSQVGNIVLDEVIIKNNLDIENEIGNIISRKSELSKADISIGTGNLYVKNSKANDFKIFSDTGDITGENFDINKRLNVDCNIGNIELDGKILGKNEIKCESGNIKLNIQNKKDLYNYDVTCNLGNLKIDNKKYDKGIIIQNNKENYINIKCEMGYVRINFK